MYLNQKNTKEYPLRCKIILPQKESIEHTLNDYWLNVGKIRRKNQIERLLSSLARRPKQSTMKSKGGWLIYLFMVLFIFFSLNLIYFFYHRVLDLTLQSFLQFFSSLKGLSGGLKGSLARKFRAILLIQGHWAWCFLQSLMGLHV